MIRPTVDVFPVNAIELMVPRIQTLDSDLLVVKRAPRDTDRTQTVGIFPVARVPDNSSIEITSDEPTLSRYTIGIQSFVKDTDEENGIKTHAILAKMIWSLLYRDSLLEVGLNALSVTMNGSIERVQRRGVTQQRYISNEVTGTFMYLSSLEYWLDTETV